ncbi:MAG: prepilin-type N-terminal cleavage/methylation domain-containing protein [Planctomycetes bacterium]|nr:prepilin-type N-terminal cleavage/methylation domain-containing protein [Planctomycetota bacterium]
MVKKASRHQGIKASTARALVFVRSRSRGRGGSLPQASSRKPQAFSARGFTLVELMIAVAILIVVIVATAKLFGTVSKVTGLGQASSDILQEAAAIERQIRNDFARLAPEGFFAIRSVAVPNDINVPLGPLLNPSLLDDAMIRADQLVFFANGVQSIQTFRQGAGSNRKGQGTAARIYYGHAFQLPQGEAVSFASFGPVGGTSYVRAHDPRLETSDPVLVPWYLGSHEMVRTVFRSDSGGSPADYFPFEDVAIDATQPPARQWLLARQAVVLADDGGDEVVFLSNNRSALWIDDPVVRNGRVDAAASQLNDIRAFVHDADGNGVTDPWATQRQTISSLVFYPRAERVAPGMHRVDQALTNNALAGACSSFIVEWTYADGVGGMGIPSEREQPWFGLEDSQRGVMPLGDWVNDPDSGVTVGPDPDDIDPVSGVAPASGVDVYEAIFGYNRNDPLAEGYTPWPSAIRITMTLHDTATRLEAGREIQFVINLPRRIE